MVLSMIVRAFLNRNLGTSYVGLNGVLTSVITSLSIADLGVDSVFIYLLYKPMAENDSNEILNLMALFKKIYICIGSVFLILGCLCIPFLKYLVGAQAMLVPHIYLIFFLFLLNTGLSYFFAAYRIILNADQKYYVIARITFIVTFLTNVVQILGLLVFKNFILYVTLLLFNTIITNIVIGWISIKRYKLGKLRQKKFSKLQFKNNDTVSTLTHNAIGGISNKLGIIIVNSSDNILLANFETLKIVGMYSNYLLVTNGVTSLLSKAIASITASIGNLGVEGKADRNLSVFIKLTLILNFLVVMAVIPMSLFFSVFINIWVGRENILTELATILIVANCLLSVIRYPALTFIDAFGLQWIQRWKSIVESAVNIIVSFILLYFFKLGLVGVLLGTLASNLLVVNWYEPYLVLREACDRKYYEYLSIVSPMFLLFLVALVYSILMLKLNVIGLSFWRSIIIISISELLLLIVLFFIYKDSSIIKGLRGRLQKKK